MDNHFSGTTCSVQDAEEVKPAKKKLVKDEYDSIYSRIMNWITLKTGIRPNTYSIFVWMRQVNDRLLRLESKQAEAAVAERAEFEAFVESLKDKMDSRIDVLEQRVGELEARVIDLETENQIEPNEQE